MSANPYLPPHGEASPPAPAKTLRVSPRSIFSAIMTTGAFVAVVVGCMGLWLFLQIRQARKPEPPVEIGEREWPPLFRSLVESAGLKDDERAGVSVVRKRRMWEHSCVLRMPANEAAIAFVEAELPLVEESAIHPSFWGYDVSRDEFGPAGKIAIYATPHRAVNDGDEYIAIHDRQKKRLVVCFRQVF